MVAVDLATRVEAAGLATRSGTNKTLFIGSGAAIPAGDGPFCSLIETPGLPPLMLHNTPDRAAHQQPRVQVVWRGRDGLAIRTKAAQSYDALFITNETLNGTFYLSVRPLQEPFDLPPDENGRSRMVFNLESLRRP